VDLAGVEAGRVSGIRLDSERPVAIFQVKIDKDVVLTDDVIAPVW
jgi:ABC-type transporter Mla subunit MlaD